MFLKDAIFSKCLLKYNVSLLKVISLLPGRILRLLEFVGFSGDRLLGMKLLTSGYHSNTCHSPLCSMSLLGYYCVIAPYTGMCVCVCVCVCLVNCVCSCRGILYVKR